MKDVRDKSHPNYQRIVDYVAHLAICHTIMIQVENGKEVYSAQSPDELALVNAAKYFGAVFKSRPASDKITIDFWGEDRTYEILKIIEFSSERKRMSIIVKDPEGKIRVLIKGADTILIPRLRQVEPDSEEY